MTPEKIAELRRLEKAATGVFHNGRVWVTSNHPASVVQYINAAMEALPTLLSSLEEARREIARLGEINKGLCRDFNTLLLDGARLTANAETAEAALARAREAWRTPLYEALKAYQRGEYAKTQIGVGILPCDLSAVILAVESVLKES